MNIRYRVTLDIGEREALASMVSGGKVSARRLKRAQLAGEMVRRTQHESVSSETVRRRLVENELKP